MGYESYKILVDLPSTSPGLGFHGYAQALAGIIRNSKPQFAIGIFGSWGSDKTTLMQAIRREIEDDPRIIPVDFSAWRYEKEEHLIIPLLDTIREALVTWTEPQPPPGVAAAPAGSNLSQRLLDTASTIGKVMTSLIAGLSFKVGLPGALEISYEASKALSQAAELEKDDLAATGGEPARQVAQRSNPHLSQSMYHASFRALRKAFGELTGGEGVRMVIFVDDLDRCLPQGALEVLESMKLFFDFEGFIFVVGVDRGVVEQAIDLRYTVADRPTTIRGEDYIKKIFQVPFSLDPVGVQQVEDLLHAIQFGADLPPEQINDLMGPVRRHLAHLGDRPTVNPREIKRYINAYTMQMKVRNWLDQDAKDVVLAIQTILFRRDWKAVNDALVTFGTEFTDAYREYMQQGDRQILADIDPTLAEIPETFREYVRNGAPGCALLSRDDLDEYIYSGEAATSSLGRGIIDTLREMAALKRFVRLWLQEGGGNQISHFSDAKIRLSSLQGRVREFGSFPEHRAALDEFDRVEAILSEDAGSGQPRKEEIQSHLNRAHAVLRDLKRRASLAAA